MKKLFIWAYTRTPNFIELCGLDIDGKMLFAIRREKEGDDVPALQKNLTELMVDNNTAIRQKYEVVHIDQPTVESVIYDGADRKVLPEAFRIAWDKYRMGETIAM